MQTFRQNVLGPLRFNVFLLGKIGAGKSSSGNTLLGRKAFIAKKSFARVTKEVQKGTVTLDEVTLDVYDTPGFTNNPETYSYDVRGTIESVSQSVPSVILLVLKFDRFTTEEKETIELIEQMLPDRLLQNIWILFTGGDELERENLSMKELIEETDELKKLMLNFQNRYHIFNNFSQSADQVKKLIKAIRGAPLTIPLEVPLSETVPRKIVLLGKTGVGKSATGNTILGQKRFTSETSLSSITTHCEMLQADVSGRTVDVVDTPGLFDTNISAEEYAEEIGNSIYLSSPGPHAFLYVLSIKERFTEQEADVVQKCELIFGKGVKKYTVILFTHGDLLKDKSVDVMIKGNRALSRLVDECGVRYHVFNNEKSINREQVNKLMEKIDRMVEHNGGCCYTNEMYEDAARFRKMEEQRVKKEEEDRKKREEEREKEIIWLIEQKERLRKEMDKMNKQRQEQIWKAEETKWIEEQQRREEMERIKRSTKRKIQQEMKDEFIKKLKHQLLIAGRVAAGSGLTIGPIIRAVAGFCVGGLPGAALGAGIGVAIGAGVGLTSAAGVGLYRQTVGRTATKSHDQETDDLVDIEESFDGNLSLEDNTSEDLLLFDQSEGKKKKSS